MRVLVTGGSGFVGSHIVDHLVAAGHRVRVLDLVDPRRLEATVEVLVGDVRDEVACARAVEGVDVVCHQAARVGLGIDFADVVGYVSDNDLGTATLLRALWLQRFSGRFVLASSMVVYGEGRYVCAEHGVVSPGTRTASALDGGAFEPPCPTCGCPLAWAVVPEDAPLDPRSTYAASKLAQEHLVTLWAREAGATAALLRYHNVYGPRMPKDTPYAGVAAIFRSLLVKGEAPMVFEDGGQTRDFVHVRDVATANVLAMTADIGGAAGAGASVPINIASGTPRTILDVARALADAFPGAPAPVVTGRWRHGDVRHVVASPGRAAALLGFTPAVPFEAGLADLAHDR